MLSYRYAKHNAGPEGRRERRCYPQATGALALQVPSLCAAASPHWLAQRFFTMASGHEDEDGSVSSLHVKLSSTPPMSHGPCVVRLVGREEKKSR